MELILVFASLLVMWLAWGFWAFLFALIALLIAYCLKPKYSWKPHVAAGLAHIGILVLGILAVHARWDEPAYTAAAVVIVAFHFLS